MKISLHNLIYALFPFNLRFHLDLNTPSILFPDLYWLSESSEVTTKSSLNNKLPMVEKQEGIRICRSFNKIDK